MINDSLLGRGPHSPHAKETAAAQSAALLVDFDNVTLGIRSDIQQQLKLIMNSDVFRGKISVHRAYADWRRYPQYIVPLSEASFDLIFAPAFGASKKNATDIRLAIDAVELVFVRPEIGTYILLSGDSDFSSLVLKLKEYGKYVIGIGILESASDLLIQNCDEYYSYGELTGFKRVSDRDEGPSRDPWGLVVDAVVQMKERGDVMRSDRLKQVMQEMDGQFSEKNAGFNKFSRFVIEAAKRGLLVATKLQNGQYEIELGRDANVEPAVEAKLTGGPAPKTRDTDARHLSLSEAFDALKKVLRASTSEGDDAVDSETVRERLIEVAGPNPVFSGQRYNRLLRQSHDAELIELTKDGDGYRLKLATRFRDEETGAAAKTAKPRARKKTRSAAKAREEGDDRPKPSERTAAAAEAPADKPAEETPATTASRSPGTGTDDAKSGTETGNARSAAPAAPRARSRSRGMGPRTRTRSSPPRRSTEGEAVGKADTPPAGSGRNDARTKAETPAPEPKSAPAVQRPDGKTERPTEPAAPPAEPPRAAGPAVSPAPQKDAGEADGGFLKRVSAVVQKAIRGADGTDG